MTRTRSSSLLLVLYTVSACGPSAAEAVRPKALSASAALGEPTGSHACHDVREGVRPLVVDWKPEQRGDLEVAMSQGIAVMSYECDKMTLLPDCIAEGSYGFKGVVFKQQLIRLQDENEIRANLPFSGGLLAAQLKAELERGTTLDLATALIGNRTGSRIAVGRSDLKGICQGATHFVRGANVGAFVMQSGERAHAATAAALFSASVDAGLRSSRLSRVEDGSVAACMENSSDSTSPPRNCGALIRIHLLPISTDSSQATAGTQEPDGSANLGPKSDATCPAGLVLQDGKCTKPVADAAHECRPGDAADCQLQCEKGQAASCARWARVLLKDSLHPADPQKIRQLFSTACEADQGDACSDLGIQFMVGKGTTADPPRALELFERACKLGEANGCFNLGNLYYEGQGTAQDHRRAFALFEQACNAGKPAGCINVGNMYDDGDGVQADSARAFTLFKKACEGDAAIGCANLAYMYAEGKSVPADQAAALAWYEKACKLGNAGGCEYAGTRYASGDGTSADPIKAQELLKRACDLGQQSSCNAAMP